MHMQTAFLIQCTNEIAMSFPPIWNKPTKQTNKQLCLCKGGYRGVGTSVNKLTHYDYG